MYLAVILFDRFSYIYIYERSTERVTRVCFLNVEGSRVFDSQALRSDHRVSDRFYGDNLICFREPLRNITAVTAVWKMTSAITAPS